jgi:hypothetical protein
MVEGGSDRVFSTTDEGGRATFKPGRSGRALLFAVRLRYKLDTASWESEFTTLTLPIAPAR